MFTSVIFLEEHMNTDHDIESSPPPPKKFKASVKEEAAKKVTKGEKSKEVSKGEVKEVVKGEKSKKESKQSKSKVNSKVGNLVNDTVCEVSFYILQVIESIFIMIKSLNFDCFQVCRQSFVFEVFVAHVDQDHCLECPFKVTCELKFVHQYHLDVHLYKEHKVGKMPSDSLRPKEEVVSQAREEEVSVDEEEVGLEDLEVEDRSDIKCYECNLSFPTEESLTEHISSHYNAEPAKRSPHCSECNLSFPSEGKLKEHMDTHYTPNQHCNSSTSSSSLFKERGSGSSIRATSSTSRSWMPSTPNQVVSSDKRLPETPCSSLFTPSRSGAGASGSKGINCHVCTRTGFNSMQHLSEHLKARHNDGKASRSYQCKWCRKCYDGRTRLADHEKLPHKYACSKCDRKYVLEPDLSWHESNRHQKEQALKEEKTGFHCTICDAKFSDLPEFRLHQAEGHSKKCHVSECNAKFGTKVELQNHVVSEHGVVDSMEMGEDVVAHLTTTRSQENIDIANWAEEWISNPNAVDHMERVMKGTCKSRRHTLFLDRRERLRCSGSDTSRLYQLSNPGFLGGGGEVDIAVIKQLDKEFLERLPKAQKVLSMVYSNNNQMAFVYASYVLFPETFIHQHQLQGKSREEAAVAFMEVAVDAEEKKVSR